MTISTTASRADYTGDSCTRTFAYTFKILANSDLNVYVAGSQKILTADYTVSGAGTATGGTVTLNTPPGCNFAVALIRNIPYTQATAYPENDPFPAATHEAALDKLTMLGQQVREFVTRSWRFAAGSVRAAVGYTVDEPKGGAYVRIKSDCTGIEYVTIVSCGTYADPVTSKGDLIVGSAVGNQERLGFTSGYTLVADPDSGRPSWQPGLSIALTNKLDAALAAGDVVAVDTGCDRAVVAANVQGCQRLFVVAPALVGDDCLALFHVGGLIKSVKAQGAIVRGRYVRKSATSQAVEDTGVQSATSPPPVGTVGLAVIAASGGLVDVMWFDGVTQGRTALFTFQSNPTSNPAAGTVSALTPAGHFTYSSTVGVPIRFKAIARLLSVSASAAPAGSACYNYTLMVDNVCTSLMTFMVATATAAENCTDMVQISCNSLISIKLAATSDAASNAHFGSLVLEERS